MSISGKTFVLGEYAVLAGLPAIVAAVPPRFKMNVSKTPIPQEFHPDSPISRLQNWAKNLGLNELFFQFEDPLHGRGGLGASTAQFGMAYLAYLQQISEQDISTSTIYDRRWKGAWRLYRDLLKDQPVVPSGADLVAQWQGGVVFFDPSDEHCLDVWPLFDWSCLLVFSATPQQSRKVATHHHLNQIAQANISQHGNSLANSLEPILIQGIEAIRENRVAQLGTAMDQYAETLRSVDLELKVTYEDRNILRNLPGVLGVKGAGALQADVLLVLLEPGSVHRNLVIETAQNRGLEVISDGLTCQMGITWKETQC